MSKSPEAGEDLPFPAPDTIRLAAESLVRYPFPVWHYGDSIGFEGLTAASELLDDPRYAAWVHGALKAWAGRRNPFRETDNTVPGYVLVQAIERTGDEALRSAALELAGFLQGRRRVGGAYVSSERAPLREPYGGFRLPTEELQLLNDPGAGVFVDCMHFDLPFFASLGALTADEQLQRVAVQQALAYLDLLQDESGLFWHFYLEKTRTRYGYGWGRGQGWALLGLLDLLQLIPRASDGYRQIADACRRLIAALIACQGSMGGWHSVVTQVDAREEASTAVFCVIGFLRASRLGIGDAAVVPAAERAWRRTMQLVDGHGVLGDVSAALWASTNPLHYLYAPTGFVVPWGQGPLLVATLEMTRLAQSR